MKPPETVLPTPENFGGYDPGPRRFRGSDERSIYLSMRDGVRLAVEVILPR